ncbi:MAG: ABC transporter ATP-binding protein [bacterium]
MAGLLLKVKDLVTNFYTYEGVVKALDGVNLEIEDGKTLGLVGETGCGKSVTALSILRLIQPPGKIEQGKIYFRLGGKPSKKSSYLDLLEQSEAFMRKVRGNEISMIFQEPSSALNPVYSINDQVSESFLLHRRRELSEGAIKEIEEAQKPGSVLKKIAYKMEQGMYRKMLEDENSYLGRFLSRIPVVRVYDRQLKKSAREKTIEILRKLGVPHPEGLVDRYPHELSGGMQQRIVIAMALACHPKLLIADEPTSNLDVTIQAQILDLIRKSSQELGTSVLFITHDLGVVAEMCNRVAVMYAGNVCEISEVKPLFKNCLHPYTKALLDAVPKPGSKGKLESIKGTVPNLINPPSGCRFHPRCPNQMEICCEIKPELTRVENNHLVACHLFTGRK